MSSVPDYRGLVVSERACRQRIMISRLMWNSWIAARWNRSIAFDGWFDVDRNSPSTSCIASNRARFWKFMVNSVLCVGRIHQRPIVISHPGIHYLATSSAQTEPMPVDWTWNKKKLIASKFHNRAIEAKTAWSLLVCSIGSEWQCHRCHQRSSLIETSSSSMLRQWHATCSGQAQSPARQTVFAIRQEENWRDCKAKKSFTFNSVSKSDIKIGSTPETTAEKFQRTKFHDSHRSLNDARSILICNKRAHTRAHSTCAMQKCLTLFSLSFLIDYNSITFCSESTAQLRSDRGDRARSKITKVLPL